MAEEAGQTDAGGAGGPEGAPKAEGPTAADPTGGGGEFVPKEKYDELLAREKAKDDTIRALSSGSGRDPNFDEGTPPPSGGSAGVNIGMSDSDIANFAAQAGLSVEDARQWAAIMVPIVQAQARQYEGILGTMADKMQKMELLSDNEVGKFYRDNQKEVHAEQEKAARAGQYLAPRAALESVIARKVMAGKYENNTGAGNGDAAVRAAEANNTATTGVRRSDPNPTKAPNEMTPDERKQLLEEAADRGETF